MLWAEAVTVLAAVVSMGTDAGVMAGWASGPRRQAMLRAAIFRLLSDEQPRVAAYQEALGPVLR